jgi:8-oxo-dGTP pyrophosphatase MutT (NUDIX family)
MTLENRLQAILKRRLAASSDYDLNPEVSLPSGRPLRRAAVLVPVWDRPDGPRMILTKRSSHLKHHPGQVAFPGGKVDPSDPSPEAAALREAQEEIGLDPRKVRILGRLPVHETVTGFEVIPVLSVVESGFQPEAEPGEVDEVFSVPLDHVLNPANFMIESRIWRGQRRRYYVVPWGPYYIWGATARILRGLADQG